MSLDSSANLLFTIGGDSSGAQAAFKQFRSVLGQDLRGASADFGRWAGGLNVDLDALKKGFAATAALAAAALASAAAAAHKATERYAEFVAEIDDGMDKTGLAAEEMSKLRFAAERMGLDYTHLVNALVRYERAVVEAAAGNERQLSAFQRLGISQRELKEGTADILPLLMRTSDAFKAHSSTVEKVAIAQELFGKSGADLVEFLSRGSGVIREWGDQARELGRVIQNEDVIAAKQFRMASQELKAELDGLFFAMGREFMPILKQFSILMIAVVETMKKDTGGPIAEFKAWIGFFEEWTTASDKINAAVEAATAAPGIERLLPPPEKTKTTIRDFEGLSNILQGVKANLMEFASEEAQVVFQSEELQREVEGAAAELAKLRKEGAITAETYKREMAAFAELPESIRQLALNRLAAIEAEREAERNELVAAFDEEVTASSDGRRSGKQAVNEALINLQNEMAGIVYWRMTAAERIRFIYDEDLERFSEVEEAKALALAESEAERDAIRAQYDLNRQAALERYQADLQALQNSQGWQGVFGAYFGQYLRYNQEAMREWAETANQAQTLLKHSTLITTETLRDGFASFAQGMGANIAQAIVYSQSIGEAMQAATAATLAQIAAQSFVQAIYATALGFLRLAMWDFAGATAAFTAAGIFASVGGAAAVAGRAIAPKQRGAEAAAGGSAGSSAGAGAGASQGASSAQSGGVQVVVNGHIFGMSGVEELCEAINDHVQGRDVRLVATQVRQTGKATQ